MIDIFSVLYSSYLGLLLLNVSDEAGADFSGHAKVRVSIIAKLVARVEIKIEIKSLMSLNFVVSLKSNIFYFILNII